MGKVGGGGCGTLILEASLALCGDLCRKEREGVIEGWREREEEGWQGSRLGGVRWSFSQREGSEVNEGDGAFSLTRSHQEWKQRMLKVPDVGRQQFMDLC